MHADAEDSNSRLHDDPAPRQRIPVCVDPRGAGRGHFLAHTAPGRSVKVIIHRPDSREIPIETNHSMTKQQNRVVQGRLGPECPGLTEAYTQYTLSHAGSGEAGGYRRGVETNLVRTDVR